MRESFRPVADRLRDIADALGARRVRGSWLFYDRPLEVGGESRALVIQTVRFFSALCSLATVILVFGIGRRFWGIGVGVLVALFVGLAPITLQ